MHSDGRVDDLNITGTSPTEPVGSSTCPDQEEIWPEQAAASVSVQVKLEQADVKVESQNDTEAEEEEDDESEGDGDSDGDCRSCFRGRIRWRPEMVVDLLTTLLFPLA